MYIRSYRTIKLKLTLIVCLSMILNTLNSFEFMHLQKMHLKKIYFLSPTIFPQFLQLLKYRLISKFNLKIHKLNNLNTLYSSLYKQILNLKIKFKIITFKQAILKIQ